jgi:hypothetical protein
MSLIIEDQTDKLTLFHYNNVSSETSNEVKQSRGKIINDNNEVVCNSFGYTPEYTVDQDEYKDLLKDKMEKCEFYKSEEGSLLRLFFYDNRWHLSTFKRIDAFTSRWSSSKTFGELFMDALQYHFEHGPGKNTLQYEDKDLFDVFCDTLDRNVVYTFLLRTNKDTKIVCTPPEHPLAYFSGCFRDGVRSMKNDTSLTCPEQLKFSNITELEDYVKGTDHRVHQGVIVMLPDQTTIKVMHPQIVTYKSIRGTEPSVENAYFRVRKSESDTKLFSELFPNVNKEVIETTITDMTMYLYKMYVRRYIKKLYTVLHPCLFHILRKAHIFHTENRSTNMVSLDKITEIVKEQSPTVLYNMYKEFKNKK